MSTSYGYTYTFPALRGIQAGREYYVAMCPLKLLPRIFLFDEAPIPPELRAQRTLNRTRVPEIARYLVENQDDYAFSAITATQLATHWREKSIYSTNDSFDKFRVLAFPTATL